MENNKHTRDLEDIVNTKKAKRDPTEREIINDLVYILKCEVYSSSDKLIKNDKTELKGLGGNMRDYYLLKEKFDNECFWTVSNMDEYDVTDLRLFIIGLLCDKSVIAIYNHMYFHLYSVITYNEGIETFWHIKPTSTYIMQILDDSQIKGTKFIEILDSQQGKLIYHSELVTDHNLEFIAGVIYGMYKMLITNDNYMRINELRSKNIEDSKQGYRYLCGKLRYGSDSEEDINGSSEEDINGGD